MSEVMGIKIDADPEADVVLECVSADWSNRGQSWTFTSVHTYACGAERGSVRVEIRANAYEDQSHAKLSVWSAQDGWLFHTSVPTEQWYSRAPSYVQKQSLTEGGLAWKDDHYAVYTDVERELLERFAKTIFPGRDVNYG